MWTYQDAVEHLLDSFDIDITGRYERVARRAVQNAYTELINRANWEYFVRRLTLRTAAQQTTGTIVYDHTGGSSERLVTLTGATWPADVIDYRIIINGVSYPVASRVSGTAITLTEAMNPGADVASTTYTLYKASYLLPADFRELISLWDLETRKPVGIILNATQHAQSAAWFDRPSLPLWAAIRNDASFYNRFSLVFSPPPDMERTYDLLYKAAARALQTAKYATGTVTTNGTTTVSGSGTAFTDRMVGCIIRFSSSTTVEPTGIAGGIAGDDNPAAYERSITAVGSGTSLTVDGAVPTLSGVKYTISDPLDIDQGTMLTALLRMAEADAARQLNRRDVETKEVAALRALRLAMETSAKAPNFVLNYGRALVGDDSFTLPTFTDTSQ